MPGAELTAVAWVAVVLALIGVLGLVFAPSLFLLWAVLLIFAVVAVPQAMLRRRAERRGKRRGR